jgi:hypothetical protein
MKRWLPVGLLALVFLAWLLWPAPPRAPVDEGAAAVASSSEPFESPRRSPARASWNRLAGVDLELLVVDADGRPLSGIEVLVDGESRTSDLQGRARYEGLQRGELPHIEPVPPWHAATRPMAPLWASETWTLVVERQCPGALVLLDRDGLPLSGVSVGLGSWEDTDEGGRAWLQERPCGEAELTVGRRIRYRVEVHGDEDLVVQLEGPHEGELLLVDPHGQPLDLEVEARLADLVEVERLGPGHVALRSLQARVGLKWEGGGQRVLLDGGLKVVVVHPLREVQVQVLGLDVPELKCDARPCEQRGGGWLCRCRHGLLSILWIEEPRHSRRIRLDEHQVTWDLRPASVQGRWIGPLPCGTSAMSSRIESAWGTCDAGGRFHLELTPGTWTVGVGFEELEGGARQVELAAGDVVDLGDIGPDSGELEGRIEADFPLRSPSLWVLPSGQAELDDEGRVRLSGLGEGQVWLILNAGEYGQFQHVVDLDGGPFTWTISGSQCDPWGACEPAESLLEDTGLDSADTGWHDTAGR